MILQISAFCVARITGMSHWCPASKQRLYPSQVELSVHGVTHQECQAALRATGGDVVSAIRNLKVKARPSSVLPSLPLCCLQSAPSLLLPQVDQLFHLSSRSRADCWRILEHHQWDLSAASRYVLARS
jgi:non-receptor tyrosine-protein kinase TNK1